MTTIPGERYLHRLIGGLSIAGVVLLVLISLTAWGSTDGWRYFLAALSIYTLVAAATFISGGLLGFLFAVPRTNRIESADAEPSSNRAGSYWYGANTNLEQIADWITKIIVGTGLTQFNAIGQYLMRISRSLSGQITIIGGQPNAQAAMLATIVFFLSCGFMGGYLLTRLYLPRMLAAAEAVFRQITNASAEKAVNVEPGK